ncbi:MAG TPA: hypothetical protein VHB25_18235 [Gemmatimonadaceae bacterium]|nr:hypothetical protein [Gemmatimonadaceae bacterium]
MDSNSHAAAASPAGRGICQLQHAPDAVTALRRDERIAMRADKLLRRALLRVGKVIADPRVVFHKLAARGKRSTTSAHANAQPSATTAAIPRRHDPPLAAGDRVRVRSRAEIAATLDASGVCDGMTFLDVVMEKYCGRTFTVRGRVNRFFDERNWKMLKLRDAVLLDGAFCEPPRSAGVDWAGCDRSCFLFWKEAWLERVAPGDETTR